MRRPSAALSTNDRCLRAAELIWPRSKNSTAAWNRSRYTPPGNSGGVINMSSSKLLATILSGAAVAASAGVAASPADDQRTVAALDIAYQAAVKQGDVATMERILHDEFALVRGDGRVVTREQIIEGARSGAYVYEQQDEIPGTQTVRVWGDTAVVTALLWVRGTYNSQPFDRRVWFSDTYVRTPAGWRYAFAQVSLPLPPQPEAPPRQ